MSTRLPARSHQRIASAPFILGRSAAAGLPGRRPTITGTPPRPASSHRPPHNAFTTTAHPCQNKPHSHAAKQTVDSEERRMAVALKRQRALKDLRITLTHRTLADKLAQGLKVDATALLERAKEAGLGTFKIYDYIEPEIACEIAKLYGCDAIYQPPPTPMPASTKNAAARLGQKKVQRRPPVVTIMGHVDHGKTTLLDALRRGGQIKGKTGSKKQPPKAQVGQSIADTETQTSREAGGITQHVSAFVVALAHEAHEDGGKAGTTDPSYTTVTFLDTPGHAAFTAIRGRGAAATDMAVIVVAADDGPMPQTLESLEMTRRAGVPVIIAINKVDKAPDNVETVRLALMAEGVELETYGGDTQCVEISAIKGQGLDDLVAAILAQADLMADAEAAGDSVAGTTSTSTGAAPSPPRPPVLLADPTAPVRGIVLETKQQKGLGDVATILVQQGTLTRRTCLLSQDSFAKVRQLHVPHPFQCPTSTAKTTATKGRPSAAKDGLSSRAKMVMEAGPSMPVEVSGWRTPPPVGAVVEEVVNEAQAKKVLAYRALTEQVEAGLSARRRYLLQHHSDGTAQTMTAASSSADDGGISEGQWLPGEYFPWETRARHRAFSLLVATDTQGSLDALSQMLRDLPQSKVSLHLRRTRLTPLLASDVTEAAACDDTLLVSFHQPLMPEVTEALAAHPTVPWCQEAVIYQLVRWLEGRMLDALPPAFRTVVEGEATIRQLFHLNATAPMGDTARSAVADLVLGSEVVRGEVTASGSGDDDTRFVRIVRPAWGDQEVYRGRVAGLRHFKATVSSVSEGQACGIMLTPTLPTRPPRDPNDDDDGADALTEDGAGDQRFVDIRPDDVLYACRRVPCDKTL